jgi:large subunit ribosomal protein L10
LKKAEKEAFVKWMRAEMETSPAMVIADYRGLTVAQLTALRGRCYEAGVQFKVVKNTLMKLSASGTKLEGIAAYLTGPTAVAWHREDPGAAARILTAFAREKEHEKFKIKGAAVTGGALGTDEVKNVLANMPTRPELLGRMAGLLAAGPSKLARTIAAGPQMLGRVLGALRDQRQGASA